MYSVYGKAEKIPVTKEEESCKTSSSTHNSSQTVDTLVDR